MRVAIVGAGAVGCLLAARLSRRGHQVRLVGRRDQVEAVNRAGLALCDQRGVTTHYELPAAETLTERPDLILLAVKTQDVAQACRETLPLARGVPVVAMQNGIQADHLAAEVLGREVVVGAVVMCAATYLQPGQVAVQFSGWLIVGEPFGRMGRRTQAIARVLGDAVPTYTTRHLGRVRWSKLISNLNNALCAATGLPLTEIAGAPAGRRLPLRLMKEGYQVARAAGLHLDHGLYGLTPGALRRDPNAALIALLQASMTVALATLPEPAAVGLLSAASRSRLNRIAVRGSTWQSIVRGRPSEIDYLNGEIVHLGQRLGVPTPYNTHILNVVREVERTGVFRRIEELTPPEPHQPAQTPLVGGAR